KVAEMQPQYGRVILADYLPAGFEIDNPRLVSSGDTGTLAWIEDALAPVYSEFRDDRFTAAFDRKTSDKAGFAIAYVVRAVSPGRLGRPKGFKGALDGPGRLGGPGRGSMGVGGGKWAQASPIPAARSLSRRKGRREGGGAACVKL